MAVCVSAGAATTKLAIAAFTLAWTHSVQKTEWQEDWSASTTGLRIFAARIESLGAGMDAPEGSVFDGHWWRWNPTLPPVPNLTLRNSGATADWRLCWDGACHALVSVAGDADPIVLAPCAD